MRTSVLVLSTLLLLASGCARTTNRQPVTVGNALECIGETVIDMFCESELESWRRVNRENLERRRQWQAENSP